jgi:hypothetical protein
MIIMVSCTTPVVHHVVGHEVIHPHVEKKYGKLIDVSWREKCAATVSTA